MAGVVQRPCLWLCIGQLVDVKESEDSCQISLAVLGNANELLAFLHRLVLTPWWHSHICLVAVVLGGFSCAPLNTDHRGKWIGTTNEQVSWHQI